MAGEPNPGKQARWGGYGARRRKMPTVARLVSLPIGIDQGQDGERVGGGDQLSPTGGWPKNSQKVALSPSGTATSPTMIAAAAVVVGGFKMEIFVRESYWVVGFTEGHSSVPKNVLKGWLWWRKSTSKPLPSTAPPVVWWVRTDGRSLGGHSHIDLSGQRRNGVSATASQSGLGSKYE